MLQNLFDHTLNITCPDVHAPQTTGYIYKVQKIETRGKQKSLIVILFMLLYLQFYESFIVFLVY